MGSIHPRLKQPVGARLAAGAMYDLFNQGSPELSQGPIYASAIEGGGVGTLSATITFSKPFDAPGSLVIANVTGWPGLTPASQCPEAGGSIVCAGFELQSRDGAWWNATATLNADSSALVLSAVGAPAGAALQATSNGFAVWPQVSIFPILLHRISNMFFFCCNCLLAYSHELVVFSIIDVDMVCCFAHV
jgi:hypothetical protein